MPAAQRDPVGVDLDQANALIRQGEPIGQDLRKRRLVPWPIVCVSVISETVPSASNRMSTFSCGDPPVALM